MLLTCAGTRLYLGSYPKEVELSETQTVEFIAWRNMRRRCSNPSDVSYPHYGGRGITVCERWAVYENFLADMGRRPPEARTLDRINNEEGYSPGNCRWTDWKTQMSNKRDNVFYEAHGLRMTAAQWAEKLGIGTDTLWRRLNVYKMPLEKALSPGSLVPTWRHGTRVGYDKGCKCAECKAAHAARFRERRRKRKEVLGELK